jgi:hypothetical protein
MKKSLDAAGMPALDPQKIGGRFIGGMVSTRNQSAIFLQLFLGSR